MGHKTGELAIIPFNWSSLETESGFGWVTSDICITHRLRAHSSPSLGKDLKNQDSPLSCASHEVRPTRDLKLLKSQTSNVWGVQKWSWAQSKSYQSIFYLPLISPGVLTAYVYYLMQKDTWWDGFFRQLMYLNALNIGTWVWEQWTICLFF